MKIIVLLCCIHSISTSSRVSGTPQNVSIDIRNNRKSQNGNISKASRLVSTHYGFSKKSKPGIRKQDINEPLFESIVFLDMGLPKTEYKLSKEASDFLLWLDIDPAPSNPLARLKRFRKNTIKSVVKHREDTLELFKNLSSNLISYKAIKQAEKPIEVQKKKTKSRRWINNSIYLDREKMPKSLRRNGSAGSLDPSMKRVRRQAEVEEAELPRWPGAPLAIQRRYHNESVVKRKILNIMRQSLYSSQEHLWPIGPLVQKYVHLTPYRMAFIFLKLDQLIHESHSIFQYINRDASEATMSLTRRLQLYGHLVRRNVDITYLTEFIMERVPRDQMTKIRQAVIRLEQEKLSSFEYGYGGYVGQVRRPPGRPNWN